MVARVPWIILAWAVVGAHAAPQYIGADACRACHSKHYESQSAGGHARSLAPAASRIHDLPFKADWAFGAGDQAVTFVSQIDAKTYLEHRLTFYRAGNTLDVTPGHQNLKPDAAGEFYPTFEPEARIMRCFACHSTGPLSLGPKSDLQPFEPGVRCESCHGPGSDHIAAAGKVPMRNPGKMTPAEMNGFCGNCHRKPGPVNAPADLRDPWNVRHQPIYFERSRCLLESAGKLNCISCHDPHNLKPIDSNEVCARCHKPDAHPDLNADIANCVNCHMPAVAPHRRLSFRNHWIGVYTPGEVFEPRR